MAASAPENGGGVRASGDRVDDALARVGAQLRADLGAPVHEVLRSAQALLNDQSASPEDVRAAAQTILDAARVLEEGLGSFEDLAADVLESDPLFSVPAAHAPPPLTQALAGELRDLARQVDGPLKNPGVAELRPRLRRAARLANIWLSTTINIDAGERTAPGRTQTAGPASEVEAHVSVSQPAPAQAVAPAPPPRGVEQPQPVPSGLGAANRALAARLEQLRAAHAELQERNEAREHHWRVLRHEIRNAAQAFLSWAYLLRRSEIGATPWFAPLTRAAESLGRRAEEAAAAPLDDGFESEIRIETFDLIALASEALEQVRPLADAQGVSLARSTPFDRETVEVQADPDRVHQILHNLLRNAIEATPQGGTVCIAVGADPLHAEVEVEDSGRGIPPERVEALFEPEPPGSRGGRGVGLPLSQQLARRMDCTLEYRPRLAGTGACFVLRIPCVQA